MTATTLNIEGDEIHLQPVTLTRKDGSAEVVYMEHSADKNSKRLIANVQVTYIIVATVALSLSAYFTYLQLKNSQK